MPGSPIIVTDFTAGGVPSNVVFAEQVPGSHTFTVTFKYAFNVVLTAAVHEGVRIDTIEILVVSEAASYAQGNEIVSDDIIVSKQTRAQASGQFRASEEGSLVVPETWFEPGARRLWRILIRVKGCRLESGQLIEPRIVFVHTIDVPVSGLPPTTLNG